MKLSNQKKIESWSLRLNVPKWELEISVQDTNSNWLSIATISVDLEGKTDEEINKKCEDLAKEIIEELGYELD